MNIRTSTHILLCGAGFMLAGLHPVQAETPRDPAASANVVITADLGPDAARALKESGDILSLESVIERVRRQYPGRIIEIELDEEDGRLIYELEVVGDDGVVREIEVDAATGDILKTERDT